jgi:hypothetical protein
MKKLVSGLLSLVLTVLSFVILSFAVAAPASANTGSIGYCQATNSDRNPYNFITASIDSLLDNSGNLKQGGINANDIVPKFSYITKDNVRKYFDGNPVGQDTVTAADCPGGPELVLAAPNDPVYLPPSCVNPNQPYGSVTVPKDLGTGIASASDPVLSVENKHFSLFYTLKPDTKTEYFQWADVAGDTKNYVLNAKHISEVNDPLYIVDDKTGVGACELSNTGAGQNIQWWMIPAGGAMFLLAALLFIANRFIPRRTA